MSVVGAVFAQKAFFVLKSVFFLELMNFLTTTINEDNEEIVEKNASNQKYAKRFFFERTKS